MLPPFGLSAVLTQWQFAPIVTAVVVVFGRLVRLGRHQGGATAPGPAMARLADRGVRRRHAGPGARDPERHRQLTTICSSTTTWCST